MADEIQSSEIEIPDELEVEIVDDAPPEDQGRKPLPAEAAQKLETLDDDELEGDVDAVRKKAKERLALAKKAWHDERREKEAAQRIADEATKLARGFQARTLEQQQKLVNGEGYLITQMQAKAKQEVELAKKAYKEAYESGDSEALTNAQELLSRATSNAIQVEQWKPTQHTALQEMQNEVQRQAQAVQAPAQKPALDARAQDWADRNVWFGKDDELGQEMTAYALAVHQNLLNQKVDPKSDEYYTTLDKKIRARFPEGFRETPTPTVVAPVQRSTKGKKVTLTQTQVSLARRFGLTNEQYAREVLKLGANANG